MDLIAIAMLCQIHSGSVDLKKIEEQQKACQIYYAQCILDHDLAKCIRDKK